MYHPNWIWDRCGPTCIHEAHVFHYPVQAQNHPCKFQFFETIQQIDSIISKHFIKNQRHLRRKSKIGSVRKKHLILLLVHLHLIFRFKMQNLRSSILKYVRVRVPLQVVLSQAEGRSALNILNLQIRTCSNSGATNQDHIKEQVLNLVKKFDKIDATKVTESADFQKDLSLDSLDRVELVMAFEQEFSIEIPDEEADKLKCCADVAQYIISGAEKKARESS
ncbi:hypothetical protein HAX54_002427 [Datura stramonium]|uniref:Acyl carrier protein n=1 Tax=Datura stramonium TaxID=4076 RepID=A0ABS8T3W8_DATST|nr:hypothetical protein [Datura stramonium]